MVTSSTRLDPQLEVGVSFGGVFPPCFPGSGKALRNMLLH